MKWNRAVGGETVTTSGINRRDVLTNALLAGGSFVIGVGVGESVSDGSFAQELRIDELTGRMDDERDRAFKQGVLMGALAAEHAVEVAHALGESLTLMTPGNPVPARVLNGSLRFADATPEKVSTPLYRPVVLQAPEDPRRLDGEMWFGVLAVRQDYVTIRPLRYNRATMDLAVTPGGDVHSQALLFTEKVESIGLVVLAQTEADPRPFSPGAPAK